MTQPLRIAMFVGRFPVASETFILRQITGLIDLGHDVHIFANVRSEETVVHDAVAYYRLLDRTTYISGPPESLVWEIPVTPVLERAWAPGASISTHNLARIVRAVPAIGRAVTVAPRLTRSLMNRGDYSYRAQSLSGLYRLATLTRAGIAYDALHAHFGPVGNDFRFASELFRAPLLVSFHGYDFSTVPRKEGPKVYERLFATAQVITANSYYTQQRLEDLGCPKVKIAQLPVGLNPDEFTYRARFLASGETVRLLTVARLVAIKGHEFVIRAIAKLRESVPNIRYDIVGEGPLREEIQLLIAELGLEGIVYLHGAKPEKVVRQFFSEAHIFVLGSVTVDGDQEGQGLVLQEAQASGLPVIATHHGAFPEGVAAENSIWLCPETDVDTMTSKLRQLIQSHRQWPAIGLAGRAFVEKRYDIRILNQRLVGLYRTAAENFRL